MPHYGKHRARRHFDRFPRFPRKKPPAALCIALDQDGQPCASTAVVGPYCASCWRP